MVAAMGVCPHSSPLYDTVNGKIMIIEISFWKKSAVSEHGKNRKENEKKKIRNVSWPEAQTPQENILEQ